MKDRIDRLFLKMTLAVLALPCSLARATDGNGDDGLGDDVGALFLGNSLDNSPADTAFPDGILATLSGVNPFN